MAYTNGHFILRRVLANEYRWSNDNIRLCHNTEQTVYLVVHMSLRSLCNLALFVICYICYYLNVMALQ